MNQRELALALGIDPAAVSRLKAKGMPVESVAVAQAWRRRHVAPYAKSSAPQPAPPGRDSAAAPTRQAAREAPEQGQDPDGAFEAITRRLAVMPRELLPLAISAVDLLIQHRLQAGEAVADVRPLLCELLAQQPDDERRISMDAWHVATGQGLGGHTAAAADEGPR